MRVYALVLLIMGLASPPTWAECSYFRVSAKLLKCVAADPKSPELKSAYQEEGQTPDLEDAEDRPLVQVRCECEYSLSGSDVRCDMDQVIERTSILDAGNTVETCRRGPALCRPICPRRLP